MRIIEQHLTPLPRSDAIRHLLDGLYPRSLQQGWANEAYLGATGRTLDELVGKYVFYAGDGDMPPAGSVGWEALSALRTHMVSLSRNDAVHASLITEVDQLREALTSRVAVEQAKGIVMAEGRCGPEEAFAVLRKVSNDSNVKLRDLAAELIAQMQQRPHADR